MVILINKGGSLNREDIFAQGCALKKGCNLKKSVFSYEKLDISRNILTIDISAESRACKTREHYVSGELRSRKKICKSVRSCLMNKFSSFLRDRAHRSDLRFTST